MRGWLVFSSWDDCSDCSLDHINLSPHRTLLPRVFVGAGAEERARAYVAAQGVDFDIECEEVEVDAG
jgi:hypothetical protein